MPSSPRPQLHWLQARPLKGPVGNCRGITNRVSSGFWEVCVIGKMARYPWDGNAHPYIHHTWNLWVKHFKAHLVCVEDDPRYRIKWFNNHVVVIVFLSPPIPGVEVVGFPFHLNGHTIYDKNNFFGVSRANYLGYPSGAPSSRL